MIRDRNGDMGFMEAVLAMMAVAVALTAFIGAAAALATAEHEEGLRFDAGCLVSVVSDGALMPMYGDYVDEYAEASGGYVRVEAEVLGGFCEDGCVVEAGVDPGSGYRTMFRTAVAECDGGRVVPVVYRVVACRWTTGA